MTVIQQTHEAHEGRTYRVDIVYDDSSGLPWEEVETLGTVSDWTRDAKPAGCRVLSKDRESFRYYDWAGAVANARSQGFNGPDAVKAVEREFSWLRDWCSDDWCWVGVVVTPLTSRNDALESYSESLWGIESNATGHIQDVMRDLMASIEDNFKRNGGPQL